MKHFAWSSGSQSSDWKYDALPLRPRRLVALYGARLVFRLATQRQPSQGRRRAHDKQKGWPSNIQASAPNFTGCVCVCECVLACSVANARHGCVVWRGRQPHQSAVVNGLVFLFATLGPKRTLCATMRGLAILVATRARAILRAGGLRERNWRRAGGGGGGGGGYERERTEKREERHHTSADPP